MGFPMAANLRKKIPKESALYINDVDASSVERFVKEYSSYGPVEILGTAKEVTEKSVRPFDCTPTDPRT
jgi:3-hydroxyisobutyrate/3-hydroxypropionate dehydrogenase